MRDYGIEVATAGLGWRVQRKTDDDNDGNPVLQNEEEGQRQEETGPQDNNKQFRKK